MLTATGEMVQQIATINNLLIFINIQIRQLQKSRGGRAPGEGPVLAAMASLLPVPGEGLRHLGPSASSLGTRVVGVASACSPGQGQAFPHPGLQETRAQGSAPPVLLVGGRPQGPGRPPARE